MTAKNEKHEKENTAEKTHSKTGKEEELKNEIGSLKKQIEELNRKIKESEEKPLRLMAELSNYKKKLEEEREKYIEFANAELIKNMLFIIDNFENAVKSSEHARKDPNSFINGIEMIYKDLISLLEKEGLKAQSTKNADFDPLKHEAVARIDGKESKDGMIIEEMRKGYEFKGRVIRPAMVKVARTAKEEAKIDDIEKQASEEYRENNGNKAEKGE